MGQTESLVAEEQTEVNILADVPDCSEKLMAMDGHREAVEVYMEDLLTQVAEKVDGCEDVMKVTAVTDIESNAFVSIVSNDDQPASVLSALDPLGAAGLLPVEPEAARSPVLDAENGARNKGGRAKKGSTTRYVKRAAVPKGSKKRGRPKEPATSLAEEAVRESAESPQVLPVQNTSQGSERRGEAKKPTNYAEGNVPPPVKGLTDFLSNFFTPANEKRRPTLKPSFTAPPKQKKPKVPLQRVASRNRSASPKETVSEGTEAAERIELIEKMRPPPRKPRTTKSLPVSPSENVRPVPARRLTTRKLAVRPSEVPQELEKKDGDSAESIFGVSLEPSKEDVDLFEEVRRRALISALIPPVVLEPCSGTDGSVTKSGRSSSVKKYRRKTVVAKPPKLLQLGDKKYRTLHCSFSSRADAIRGDCIYMCEFCLRQFDSSRFLSEHYESCAWHSPPGSILYRDTVKRYNPFVLSEGKPTTVQEEIVIYEVDGRDWALYCQRLALLGKLFIHSKNLLYDVEHFCFYVLCYRNTYGDHVMGYFSKDKAKVPDCFNLSCIVVLPPYQGVGYGKLLVEFSYLISRVNIQPGTPEKPLSDDGERTYKSVWKRKLLEALAWRKKDNALKTTLNDMAAETGMCAQDVAGILVELKVLKREEKSGPPALKRTRPRTSRRAAGSWGIDMNAQQLTDFMKAMEEDTLPKKIVLDEKKLCYAPKKQREEGEAA
ncbi:hypothetical protein RvY_00374 [Ramazzottius varieornatus]|uniref:histone acetyltransferase n=1 Tax=Ramazzottius varieornatus TaxID=947166 RepID=A0A1D1UCK1_RAMVA|nr:hypothetical protein RvY_00374 [Ramazzottius varieornatus]